ncbi:MAG: hypothetical protein CGU28_02185 [Candidatus Dactylopiibacterium carminicum]|uniref:Phage coat protein n=1 Tax=Candidatus Dactylopiibacterium carminicum TaxID=857335 RepID=A0A272EVE8_9RHOO|nr:hypothetical protein [Candidatus Dactylopiibacterium carminicum]KAF7600095.1 hypothetical protein BGI27_04165 [Candidatus Dactylopiibacterium carminicum]PAS94075.1 MAG: hypothetical protein CGU29_05390 [Candidatus Dactylopiibacterium carminicum]PAS98162.1 MAG: hypothetical protein CGU28_02185 [Candidatus Dactylopiibacterium carminicum]
MLCLSADLQAIQSEPASVAECPYVVFTGAEAVSMANSPWNLSISEAAQIGGVIWLVWGAAWGLRTLANFLNSPDKEPEA